jgi:hypothetical protein
MENKCSEIEEPITSMAVRDAILHCFYEAHKDLIKNSVDMPEEQKELFSEVSIKNIIVERFQKVGGDFENPTKESLFYVIISLTDIAKSFRDINMIVNHFLEMLKLIDKIKDN